MTIVYDTEELTVRRRVRTFGVRGRSGRRTDIPSGAAVVGSAIVGTAVIGTAKLAA